MANVLNNIKQVWQQASPTHKMLLISIVLGFAIVAGLLVNWASQPNLALLYGGLNPDDAAKITEKLRDEDIPHKLQDGGRTILVPKDQVNALRLKMVLQGIPSGGNEGYQILDRDGLGISPFKEKVNYLRALSGELVKTIMLIDGVASARVHVVSEDQRLMSRGQQEASASVYIKTNGGRKLTQENVIAIANLVAGAVKGVMTDKVKVIVNGHTEAGGERDEMTAMSGSLLEYKMKVEQYLSRKAEEQLAIVLGPGHSTVKVNATLSTTSLQKTIRKLDSKNRVETKMLTRKKDVKDGETGGGSRGNAKPGGSQKDTTEEVEYDVPWEWEQEVSSPGKIESVAVAVFVDLSAATSQNEGEDGATTPASKLKVKDIEDAVRNALGLKTTDSIKVVDVPFQQIASEEPQAQEAGMFSGDMILEIAQRMSLGLVVVGALLALKILKGRKPKVAAVTESSVGAEGGDAAIGGGGSGGGGGGGKTAVRQLKGADRALRQRIVGTLATNPDQVKQLFLSWMESSESK